MSARPKPTGVDTSALLSTPWIVVMLNVIIRDVTATGSPDLDDLFFAAVGIVVLLVIVWSAARWRGGAVPVDPSGPARVDATTR